MKKINLPAIELIIISQECFIEPFLLKNLKMRKQIFFSFLLFVLALNETYFSMTCRFHVSVFSLVQ